MGVMAYVQNGSFLEPLQSGFGHMTLAAVLLENIIITIVFLQRRKEMIS